MPTIQLHRAGIDSPSTCEECRKEGAAIVMEGFPTGDEKVCLRRKCAATALSEHPRLLASAVISLILTRQGSVNIEQ